MLKLCLQNFSLNHDHDHDHEENICSRTITITTPKKVRDRDRDRDREIDDHAGHYSAYIKKNMIFVISILYSSL